jgi:WD40 repeat protein
MANSDRILYEYQVGGNLAIASPTYIWRQADRDLYAGIQKGEFCYVLNSRQMGKSSLRVQTMHRLQAEGFICAVIDLTTIGTEQVTPEQWYASLIDSLIRSLKLKVNLVEWWRSHNLLSPVQRWSEFLADILLIQITDNIVIFIDEIDSVLSLKFSVEDFFGVIRSCYNQRADVGAYKRLTFVLLGVATPSDLMQDKNRTPFNIGRAIALTGFKLDEAQSLSQGFAHKTSNPQEVLKQILDWSGGQPFLTQKICKLVATDSDLIPIDHESDWIRDLVRSQIIHNWELQDEPTHLKTIRDRLLRNSQRAGKQLGLYQQILQASCLQEIDSQGLKELKSQELDKKAEVMIDDSLAQIELRLSGLVGERAGHLKVYNPIYASIFDLTWVANLLASLRPYSEALGAWNASHKDESWLLRGQALRDAQVWAEGKSLSDLDYWFLDASRELEGREVQIALGVERKAKEIAEEANRILSAAQQKVELALQEEKQATQRLKTAQQHTKSTIRFGFAILALIIVIGGSISFRSLVLLHEAESQRQQFRISGLNASSQLLLAEDNQIGALIASITASHQLLDLKQLQSPDLKELYNQTESVLQTITYSIQEYNRLLGHIDRVNSIAFTPDGETIATASKDRTVRIWDRHGKLLNILNGHLSLVESVSFSPDRKFLVSAEHNGRIIVWQANGIMLHSFLAHQSVVSSVAFSPDSKAIASASWDNRIRLWEPSGVEILTKPMSHRGAIYSVAFSADGKTFASAGEQGDVKIWDRNGNEINSWQAHKHQINALSFNPNSNNIKAIASASNDGTVKLWDRSGKLVQTLRANQGGIYSLQFSPNGKAIASGSNDGKVTLWRTLDGKEINTFKKHNGAVYSITFSPDGEAIATASFDSSIKLWHAHNSLRQDLKGHDAEVNHVTFSPDGQTLATASQDGTIKLWSRNGEFLKTLTSHGNWYQSVSFSPDGKIIATASRDWTAKLWNYNGTLLKTLSDHRGRVYSVSFSPDGKTIATASYDGRVRLWNQDGTLLQILHGHKGSVYDVSFSPDGKTIATASSDWTAKLWNYNGTLLKTLSGHRGKIYSVSFSPDGQILATASHDGTVKLWQVSDRTEIMTLQGNSAQGNGGQVYSVSFSPNGKVIASAYHNETIKLWDRSGRFLRTLKGHRGAVQNLSFSPDSQLLASASRDNTVILWHWNLELKDLLKHSCDLLQDYLQTDQKLQQERFCQ